MARSAARGERSIPARDFFTWPFTTSVEPDEILTELHVPTADPSVASAYRALPQPASGYPIAGVAVVLTRGRAGRGLSGCAIGVTGVEDQPYRAVDVERAVLAGTPFAEALSAIATGQRVASDIHADRKYRSAMAVVMARRAFDAAVARLA